MEKKNIINYFLNLGGIFKRKEKIVIKEVIKYVGTNPDYNDFDVFLREYLPISFFDDLGKNDEFKNHTIDAYIKNNLSGNFQFSYIAYYMLFVSYLYKITWELKTIGDSGIITNIDNFIQTQLGNDLNFVFDLSGIGEDSFCRNVNNYIRCLHKNEIDEIVNFVQKRNHCAHPSGIIQYTQSELENLIGKIDTYTKKIQNKVNIQLLNYVKDNLDKISFNKELILSENEILFLLAKKDEILNFNSDSDENIRRKMNFLNLIYNNYTENINFEDGKIYELFLELFKGYDKNIALYYYLEELHFFIKSFKSEDNKLIEEIKKISLEKDDEFYCIGFIENI